MMNKITDKKLSLWELIEKFKIQIPKIQRDYIQGRKSAKKNIKEFIDDLFSSLKNNVPLSLNFVYGVVENQILIPIDGQQRLTTLFLLHLYIFAKAKKLGDYANDFKLFSYETRMTTNRFIVALIENAQAEDFDFSDIKNYSWYKTTWDNDISIVSCITTLKLIDAAFKQSDFSDMKTMQNRLIGDCPITFMFMTLENFGSADELYIRMNSRGKQLSDFENFKAELYEKVEVKDIDTDFKGKVDGAWTDLLWHMTVSLILEGVPNRVEKHAAIVDELYRDFFHWIFMNHICVSKELKPDSGKKSNRDDEDAERKKTVYDYLVPGAIDREDSSIYIDDYFSLVSKDKDTIDKDSINGCVLAFAKTFDLLAAIKEDSKLFASLTQWFVTKPEGSKEYSFTVRSYNSRLMLYAITCFAEKCGAGCLENFKKWYRVFTNLINNTETDRPDRFYDKLMCINNCDFVSLNSLLEFNAVQIKEEILKQELIEKDNAWKKAIYSAEGMEWENTDDSTFDKDGVKYFSGQLFFLLDMAKIKEDNYDLDSFIKYAKIAFDLFANDKIGADFHRALLTYGDYKKSYNNSGWRYTLYCYNEKHKNNDWHGALRQNADGNWSIACNYIKEFIKEYEKKESTALQDFCIEKQKCVSFDKEHDPDGLCFPLIKHKEYFDKEIDKSKYLIGNDSLTDQIDQTKVLCDDNKYWYILHGSNFRQDGITKIEKIE